MIINDSTLATARQLHQAFFTQSLKSVPTIYQDVCTSTQISGSNCTYHFLDELSPAREWLGEREIQALRHESVTIEDKEWEKSIGITRKELEDDALGLIQPRISALAGAMARVPDRRLLAALVASFTTLLGHDGVTLIASTHPRDGGLANQSNTAGGAALSTTTFETGVLNMQNFTDRKGDPLGLSPAYLMYGPKLRSTAFSILEAEYWKDTGGGSTAAVPNPNKGLVKPLLNRDLVGTYDDYWFLIAERDGLRPFIFQNRVDPEFEAQDTSQSDALFMRGEIRYGARRRCNVGAGLWYMIYGSAA